MNCERITEKQNINKPMRILTGIAIILVVLGHLDFDVLSLGGLFPYYSFHVCVFVFVSGYFYKSENEQGIGKYILKKASHLLLPYYVWNLIYGIISTVLANKGFSFCNKISLFNLFVEPFLGGHQYGLNFAAWFVPALFAVELLNVLWRKIMSCIGIKQEWIYAIVSLVIGIAVVWAAKGGHVWGYYKTPGRILFMLPIFEMGQFYKTYLEEKTELISNYIFFPIIISVQLLLVLISDGAMNFSVVWCTGFASLAIMPYLSSITGIAFFLRISKCLAKAGECRLLEKIGSESFSIMMHHVFAFFLINSVSLAICYFVNPAFSFDVSSYKSDANYVYLVRGIYAWKIVYLCIAIVFSIFISKISSIVLAKFKNSVQR